MIRLGRIHPIRRIPLAGHKGQEHPGEGARTGRKGQVLLTRNVGDMTMHLKRILLFPEKYPTDEHYPFNKRIFRMTREIEFRSAVTFFLGENGTGKSTLLEALAYRSGIHIWRDTERIHLEKNPYEKWLYRFIAVEWTDGVVAGSFFSSDLFGHFAQNLDEWAASDPQMLGYFGGKSLVAQSHGQSLMSYFRARYRIRGLYLLDEPETALSPRSQLEFVRMLKEIGEKGYAQFVIATHSPIILACPGAEICSFNEIPVRRVEYHETDHYRIYRDFMRDPEKCLSEQRPEGVVKGLGGPFWAGEDNSGDE